MCPNLCLSVSKRGLANLTDVTLADQATNSIQTDNVNMAIQGNVAMQVDQYGGQLWNPCKWRKLVNQLSIDESDTLLWPSL